MAKARKLAVFLGGFAAAGAVAVAVASSAPAKAASGRTATLTVVSNNFAGGSSLPANTILQLTFNYAIDPASVNPATILVRGQNATLTGYTKQVFGSYQVVGNVVRFYPRLPTHLRDAAGKFFPEGSTQDDAAANAGFRPSTGYEVRLIGRPHVTTVASTGHKPLPDTRFLRFSVAPALPADKLWTTQSYSDSPPPQFQFSNPPDTPPSSATQYATHGGTQDVPNSIMTSLFCTKVPLASGTVRDAGNVELTMLARKGNYALRRPVAGSVFVEQNFDTTLLAFQPKVALADLGTYGLRVTKALKDLTEQNDFSPNHARDVLNQLYGFLSSARALSPGTPVAQLPDPSLILTPDWPSAQSAGGPAARGVLKTNLLALGDTYKDEIDPRMMLIFTTRDEPVTSDQITVEFTKAENLYDATLSIGTVDVDVPSSAAAVFTASGGSGVLGDLIPTSNVTYAPNQGLYPNSIFNFRNLVIPPGVTVTFTGSALPNPPYNTSPPVDSQNPPRQAPASIPVTVRCLTFQLDGTIAADGAAGVDGDRTNLAANYSAATGFLNKPGGPGGPGGGNGGYVTSTSAANTPGGTGGVGNDANLLAATTVTGGQGGIGGRNHSGTIYSLSGGGGGGGGRTPGASGTVGTYPTLSWNGPAGAGGAGATGNTDLAVLVGGAGGGGGGPGTASQYGWGASSGTGGGGGGALMIQTASTLSIGATGVVRAKGGKGGQGMQSQGPPQGGGAGGGGGGSVLLRSSRGFNLSNQLTAVDVTGGVGGSGSPYSAYYSGAGGAGGSGFIKFEDPNGGITIPTSLAGGVYSPSGGGVPSYVYMKWVDLGVQDPRIVQWGASSFVWANTNDSIYIQAQMTRENPTAFGKPDLSAIKVSDQSSTNTVVMSQWQPIFVSDRTGIPGGAFAATLGAIPGYPPNPPTEYSGFDPSPFNGKAYRFIRFRMYFQLDATQTQTSAVPYVDRIITKFEYNF